MQTLNTGNVRAGASTTATIDYGGVPAGTQMTVRDTNQIWSDGYWWLPISYQGSSDYIITANTQVCPGYTPQAAPATTTAPVLAATAASCVQVASGGSGANIRGAPCINPTSTCTPSVLYVAADGTQFTVLSVPTQYADGYTWIPIASASGNAWIAQSLTITCPTGGGGSGSGSCGASSLPLFKQSDPQWGSNTLGACAGMTISSSGCAMTSATMAQHLYGYTGNPGDLNTWLLNNGGYNNAVDCWIVWGATAGLPGGVGRAPNYYSSLALSDLQAAVGNCQPVIVNVLGGSHWVLLWGSYSGTTFSALDPGYATTSYDYSGMLAFVVYPNS